MNKYDRFYREIEIKSSKNEIKELRKLDKKIAICLKKLEGEKISDRTGLVFNSLLGLSLHSKEFVDWYKNEIMSNLYSPSLLTNFLIRLNYELLNNDDSNKKNYIDSLEMSGLVSKVEYDKKRSLYRLTMNDSEEFDITNSVTNEQVVRKFNGKCHYYTEKFLEREKENNNLLGSTVIFKDSFYNPHFHSFAISKKDDKVIDLAHNISCDFRFYLDYLYYETLMKEDAKTIIDGIENLTAKDQDFLTSKKGNMLKYSIRNIV